MNGITSASVKVHFDAVLSPEERDAVQQWIGDNDSGDIENVSIDENVVSVHGSVDALSGVSGTIAREGNLLDELDAARDGMRRLASGPDAGDRPTT
jgi:hypothetical protein